MLKLEELKQIYWKTETWEFYFETYMFMQLVWYFRWVTLLCTCTRVFSQCGISKKTSAAGSTSAGNQMCCSCFHWHACVHILLASLMFRPSQFPLVVSPHESDRQPVTFTCRFLTCSPSVRDVHTWIRSLSRETTPELPGDNGPRRRWAVVMDAGANTTAS